METSLFNRVQAGLLALATVALLVLAVFNLLAEQHYDRPYDGVWWREAKGGLVADRVLPDMPGERAGIQQHDLLTAVNGEPVTPHCRPGARYSIASAAMAWLNTALPATAFRWIRR